MSLYGDYIKELRGDGIVETIDGFATYRYLNDGKTIYIIDIYVVPGVRENAVATALANEIEKIGKAAGATEMWGTVSPSANNSTESVWVLLKYGMRLHGIDQGLIVFRKDIK
jgi:hypothetical protein